VVRCRCKVLNGLSGDVARDYLTTHLEPLRVDGMGRTIHHCPDTGIEWAEEREPGGYADDVTVLRRVR
jgi:hypothetical protein